MPEKRNVCLTLFLPKPFTGAPSGASIFTDAGILARQVYLTVSTDDEALVERYGIKDNRDIGVAIDMALAYAASSRYADLLVIVARDLKEVNAENTDRRLNEMRETDLLLIVLTSPDYDAERAAQLNRRDRVQVLGLRDLHIRAVAFEEVGPWAGLEE